MQALVENLEALLLVGLGAIHRDVGVAQKLLGFLVPRVTDRYADAGRGKKLLAVDGHRLLERLDHPLGNAHRGIDAGDVLDQQGELVAAQPRHHIRHPHAGRQPDADLLEQCIAHQMASAVVDHLESVEVHEQHREGFARIARLHRQRPRQSLAQVAPVRQAGQEIVQCLMLQQAFDLLARIHLVLQLAAAVDEFELEFDERFLQLPHCLRLADAMADLVCDENQQFLVLPTEAAGWGMPLEGQHTEQPLMAGNGHAKPSTPVIAAGGDAANGIPGFETFAEQAGAQGFAAANHLLGHFPPHGMYHRFRATFAIQEFQAVEFHVITGNLCLVYVQQTRNQRDHGGQDFQQLQPGGCQFGNRQQAALALLEMLQALDLGTHHFLA